MTRSAETQDYAPDAVILDGIAHNGKPCRLVDNTGSVARAELEALFAALIREKQFGLQGLSGDGGNAIKIGAARFSHVQLGTALYRLLLFPYEARIEKY